MNSDSTYSSESISISFRENYYNTLRNISLFNKKIDWSCELNRCGATGWRVLSTEREDNMPLGTLPTHYVIPAKISDIDYTNLANVFRNGRAAIWVYSLENASLVRMAELMPSITDTRQENMMLEIVRQCDPLRRQPFILELSKCLPNVQDVQISFTKLRELFTADSTRQFIVSTTNQLIKRSNESAFVIVFFLHFSNKTIDFIAFWRNRVGSCTLHYASKQPIWQPEKCVTAKPWCFRKMMAETCAASYRA